MKNIIYYCTLFFIIACCKDDTVFENDIPFTPEKRHIADKVISVFENGDTAIRYNYIEYLDDGRGFTVGRAGFTSADGDLVQVIKLYTSYEPTNPLKDYIPRLEQLASAGSDDTTGLDGFRAAWILITNSPLLQKAQDSIVNELYYLPAVEYAEDLGIHSPLALLCIYDAIVQHGDGDDEDGLQAIIDGACEAPADGGKEVCWIKSFNKYRRKILKHANNPDTRDEWKESVGRVDALDKLCDDKNFELNTSFIISPYGDSFEIK